MRNLGKALPVFKMRFNQGLGFEEKGFSSTIVPHESPPISDQTLVNEYDSLVDLDWGWDNSST